MSDEEARPLSPEPDETAGDATQEPIETAEPGEREAADDDGAGEETHKRRRRGRRGGKRHRRKGPEGDEAPVADDAGAVAAPAGEAPAAAAEAEVQVESEPRVATPAEPAESERPKRRRRGSRSKKARDEAGEVASDVPEEVVDASAAVTAKATSTGTPIGSFAEAQADTRGAVGARGRRRRGKAATTDEAEPQAAPVESTPEPVVETPVVEVETSPAVAEGEPGVETETGEGKTGRRRGRRGGRGRRKAAPVEEAEAVEQAPVRAATVADQAPVASEVVAEEEADVTTGPAAKRRRRRGGKAAAKGGEAAAPPVAEKATEKVPEKPAEPRRRRDRFAKPALTVAPDLPGHKEILVTTDAEELRVALVEDGRLAEIYFERPGKRSYAGNIYRGKVDNVLPGMDAAFVDIGLDRNGFLYVDEIADPDDGSKRPNKITQMLKPGQEVLVQVSKDPMGSKGARLTGQLSLAGRYLVYVPGGSGVGVSRRLGQDERDRLRDLCKTLKAKDAGLIVRTVAEGKGLDELKRDLQFLSRLWTRLKKKGETVKAPGLVYEEADVSLQVARDLYNDTFSAVLVDDAKQKDKLVSYLDKTAPELAERVRLYDAQEPLFKAHGIEEQISRALERRVPLPSGGNLVIDHTEALTVIDVNTGRFTGGKHLEDTITRNNLEAAREVVRQLRLRDIGGIIIIDFIDMEHPKNREAVLGKLQAELETDRTKTYVVEISPLGLVEMTRQNITDGARGILTQTCPVCEGKARVPSPETIALNIERRLYEHAGRTGAKALLMEVNGGVADRMVAHGRTKRIEKATGKRLFFEGSRQLPVDTFRIVAEGTVQAVETHRIPVREEQELTVDLEYGLTYSPGDAVAHVEGYQLVVLNGRRYLGEKKKVKIVTTTRAGGIAALGG